PYGHAGCRRHYASTAAHPAFSVDGLDQAECAGELVETGPDGVTVACAGAYDGVRAVRRVALAPDGALHDELTVTADRPRRIAAHLRPDVPLSVRIGPDGSATTVWDGSLRGTHTASVPARFAARPGPGPADDPQRTRTHVDWVAEDAAAVRLAAAPSPAGLGRPPPPARRARPPDCGAAPAAPPRPRPTAGPVALSPRPPPAGGPAAQIPLPADGPPTEPASEAVPWSDS